MRRTFTYALPAVLLAGLVGGAVVDRSDDKTVRLTVDGEDRTIRTNASTVEGALDDAGVHIGAHDEVVPDRGESVRDGGRVVLDRGRLVKLVVDGTSRDVWVTARSVDEVLDEVGVRADGARLSASRSHRVPLAGLALAVSTSKRITVVADGRTRQITSAAPTVGAALAEAGLGVDRDDLTSVARSTSLRDGLDVRVIRVTTRYTTKTADISYRTVRRPSASLDRGDTRVVQRGVVGRVVRRLTLVYADGKLADIRVRGVGVAKAARPRIVEYGTRERAPERSSRSASRSGSASSGHSPSADGLDWAALARCESGGNPRAVNASGKYRGLYQFSLATWHAVGGAGDPINASSGEQTYRAQILYRRAGAGQWPECGRYL